MPEQQGDLKNTSSGDHISLKTSTSDTDYQMMIDRYIEYDLFLATHVSHYPAAQLVDTCFEPS